MKNLLYVVFILLIMNQAGLADDRSAVKELLESKLDAAIEIMQKKDLEQKAKNKKIIAIVTPIFNFPLMAKLSLGRKYWPGLSKEKKERFTYLFIKRLKASYVDKLTLYTD